MEIRALRNPPKLVKTALESVCLLLGEQSTDWKEIRSIIMKDNFIPDIVKFSTEDIRYVTFINANIFPGRCTPIFLELLLSTNVCVRTRMYVCVCVCVCAPKAINN